MCTLAIYFRVFDSWPVVIGANRDEFLARPALPPGRLADAPEIVGGKDVAAGGTWLGINQHGLVAGLLNRRSDAPNDPTLRSRGLLCLDSLARKSVAEAADFMRQQRAGDYNPFNLMVAGAAQAFVARNRSGRIDLIPLEPGLHLLTNLDLDDPECPRISRSFERFAQLGRTDGFAADPVAARVALGRVLADHSTQLDPRSGRPNSLCLHLGEYGTRSSSLVFLGRTGLMRHFFAPGPPCITPYEPAPVPEALNAQAESRRSA